MKKILLLFIGLIWLSFAIAQESEHNNGYRGYFDFAVGDDYNLNTAQTVSTNNMQWYTMLSTTHGFHWTNWFAGAGVGYYHSYRDKENMYPIYAAGRYTFEKTKLRPFIGVRAGILYDPYWVDKMQKYGALGTGLSVYKGFQVGLRVSVFSRPSRYFTANAAVVLCYEIGN
jgi:hypothetical protein